MEPEVKKTDCNYTITWSGMSIRPDISLLKEALRSLGATSIDSSEMIPPHMSFLLAGYQPRASYSAAKEFTVAQIEKALKDPIVKLQTRVNALEARMKKFEGQIVRCDPPSDKPFWRRR